jgi:rare lipoprotein A
MIAMKSFGLSALIAIAAISSCYAQTFGLASYYSCPVAVHRTLPFGARIKVTNLKNGRVATVVIVGRRPFARGRIIDVSTKVGRTYCDFAKPAWQE